MIRDQTGVSLIEMQNGNVVHHQQSLFEKDIQILNDKKLTCK